MASILKYLQKIWTWIGRQIKRGGRVLRWFLIVSVIIVVFVSVCCAAMNYWLNDGNGKTVLISILQEQLGAQIEVDNFKINLPRGIKVSGLRIRLPGVNSIPEAKPSIVVGELRFRISLLSFFYGTFKLKEGIIEGLEIHASREDGVLWTAGLTKYLENRAKAKPAIEKPKEEVKEPGQAFSMKDLNSIIAKVAIPFRIKIEEVGLKRFSFDFTDRKNKKVLQFVSVGPINAFGGMTAWMRTSHLWAKLDGSENGETLKFIFNPTDRPVVIKNFQLKSDFTFDNLNRIFATSKTVGLTEDLNFALEILMSPNYQTIDLKTLDLKLGKILNASSYSKVNFSDGDLDKIAIEANATGALHLNRLNPYLKPFNIEVTGDASLDKMLVHGKLVPSSFSTIEKAILPSVDITLATRSISVSTKQASLKDLNVDLKTLIQAQSEGGASFTHKGSISLESVLLNQPVEPGKSSNSKGPLLQASDIKVATNINGANITDKKAVGIKEFEIDTHIGEIVVRPPQGGNITTELNSRITMATEGFLNKLSVLGAVEIGKELKAGLNLECLNECQNISVIATTEIPRIDRLVMLVTPALGKNAASLPSLERGAFNLASKITAQVPPGPLEKFAERAKKAKGKVSSSVSLKDLNIVEGKSKTEVSGFSFNADLTGEIEKQSLKVTSKIESVKNPAIPKPLLASEFGLGLLVEDLSKLTISDIRARIPSLGARVDGSITAELNDAKEPQNIAIKFDSSISPKEIAPGMAAIEASGVAKNHIEIQSNDLSTIVVRGFAELTEFSLRIPQPKEANSEVPLIAVENMNGYFPFAQSINLSDFKKPEPIQVVKDNSEEKDTKQDTKQDSKAAKPEGEQTALTSNISKPDANETKLEEIAKTANIDEKISEYLLKYKDSKSMSENRMKQESYGEVRASQQHYSPIFADRIAFKDLAITNVEIDAELSQNMFSLNQMVFSLLGGKVQAAMQVSFDTKLRKARVTGQCTELDTRKLADSFPKLRDKMSSFSLLGSSPYLDGTMRLLYDAPSGDIAGGVEVTRIGKDQMRAVLLYVDPEETNPTISTMRKALSIGEVRQVSVPIRNGQIGLDLDVRLLKAPIPTPKLQRFPLAQLVRNFTGGKTATDQSKTGKSAKNSEAIAR